MTAKKETPAKPKFEGLSLKMDVMKKIAFQLDRIDGMGDIEQVLDFVRRAVMEKKLGAVKGAVVNGMDAGQLGLAAPGANGFG